MDVFGLDCSLPRNKSSNAVALPTHTEKNDELKSSLLVIERKIIVLEEQVGKVSGTSHEAAKQNAQAIEQLNSAHLALVQQITTRLDGLQRQLDEQNKLPATPTAHEFPALQQSIPNEFPALQQSIPKAPLVASLGTAECGATGRARPAVTQPSNHDLAERFRLLLEDLEQDPLEARLERMQQQFEECIQNIFVEMNTPLQALMEAENERQKQAKVLASGDRGAHEGVIELSAESVEPTEQVENTTDQLSKEDPHVSKRSNLDSEYFAQNLDEAIGEFVFSPSVWDASLLIGVTPMGMGATLQLLVILVINITVQVIYTVLIDLEMTDSNFDNDRVADLVNFRNRIAHSYKYQDDITKAALAARLCAGDGTLELAASQSDALADIDGYLPRGSEENMFGDMTGQMMCILALVVWCLVVTKEIRAVCTTCLAVGKRRLESLERHATKMALNGDKWVLQSFSYSRLVIIAFVLLLRLFIAGFLLQAGMKFLVHTIQLPDLVLNAVALDCILQLDELIYETLAPQRVKVLVDNLEPLPLPTMSCGGIDLPSICGMVFIKVLVFIACVVFMFDEVSQLKKARSALCDGDKDFVYIKVPMVPYFQWAGTPRGWQDSLDSVSEDLVARVVDGQTDYQMLKETKAPESRSTAWSLETSRALSMPEWTIVNNYLCQDLFGPGIPGNFVYQSYITLLRQRFPDQHPPVASCIDIKSFCDHDTSQGIVARSVCPVTCGCDDPLSELVLGKAENGCPSKCIYQPAYQALKNTTACVDRTAAELSSMPAWGYLATQIVAIAEGRNNTGAGWPFQAIAMVKYMSDLMLGPMHLSGCAIIPPLQSRQFDLCSEDERRPSPTRSFRLICPQTCNCTLDLVNCPRSCPAPF